MRSQSRGRSLLLLVIALCAPGLAWAGAHDLDGVPGVDLIYGHERRGLVVFSRGRTLPEGLVVEDERIVRVGAEAATEQVFESAVARAGIGGSIEVTVRDRRGRARKVVLPVTRIVDPQVALKARWVGKQALDLTGAVASGPAFTSLAALRGGWVLVDFWGTFCQPCVAPLAEMHAVEQALGDRLRVVAFSSEPAALQRWFAKKHRIAHSLVVDQDDKAYERYGLDALPTMLLVDPSGVVRYVHVGYPDREDWAEVKQLVSARP